MSVYRLCHFRSGAEKQPTDLLSWRSWRQDHTQKNGICLRTHVYIYRNTYTYDSDLPCATRCFSGLIVEQIITQLLNCFVILCLCGLGFILHDLIVCFTNVWFSCYDSLLTNLPANMKRPRCDDCSRAPYNDCNFSNSEFFNDFFGC